MREGETIVTDRGVPYHAESTLSQCATENSATEGKPREGRGDETRPASRREGTGERAQIYTTYPSMVPGHAKKNALNCELNCELSCSQPKSLLGL